MPEESENLTENEEVFCDRKVRMVAGILCRKNSGALLDAMLVDRGL